MYLFPTSPEFLTFYRFSGFYDTQHYLFTKYAHDITEMNQKLIKKFICLISC